MYYKASPGRTRKAPGFPFWALVLLTELALARAQVSVRIDCGVVRAEFDDLVAVSATFEFLVVPRFISKVAASALGAYGISEPAVGLIQLQLKSAGF